ncbi:MAG: Na+-transporting NADH:ubiquinone oxidoreductase subunit G, partial [Prevotella sp.]|nr:Na+-transporting NADH:ubiquinone oxidoreductase subunit G [Prevotella sp.]
MKKLKSNLQNMVLVLVGVALICGGTLAYVNQLTKSAIDEQAKKTLADGIKAVLDADDITVNSTSEKKRIVNGKEQTFVIYNTDKGVAV